MRVDAVSLYFPQDTEHGKPLEVVFIVLLATLKVVIDIAETAANDFFVFVNSARWLREGVDPYQHPLQSGPGDNLNTPPSLLIFVPLSFLSDAAAFQVWTTVSIAAFPVSSSWIARAAAPGRVVTVAAVIFLSQAAITSLLLGQITGVLVLAVTAAWIADRENRPTQAGVLLGIAIVAKPFLGVFLGYALWRRARPLLAGMVAGFAGFALLGLAACGLASYRSWLAALGQISWTAHWLNGSLLGLLTRAMTTTPEVLNMTPLVDRPELVRPLWWGSLVVVAGLVGRTLLLTRDRDRVWCA